jgi:hypothetical protein
LDVVTVADKGGIHACFAARFGGFGTSLSVSLASVSVFGIAVLRGSGSNDSGSGATDDELPSSCGRKGREWEVTACEFLDFVRAIFAVMHFCYGVSDMADPNIVGKVLMGIAKVLSVWSR